MRSSLSERWTQDVNTLSTSVLRLLEEETSKSNTNEVRAVVSPDMSALLLNERRIRLNDIEARSGVKVVVISDATRPDSRFEVIRIKDGKVQDPDKSKSSISAAEQFEKKSKKTKRINEEAAVKLIPSAKPKKGVLSKIVNLFKPKSQINKIAKKKPTQKKNVQPKNARHSNRNKRFDNKGKILPKVILRKKILKKIKSLLKRNRMLKLLRKQLIKLKRK